MYSYSNERTMRLRPEWLWRGRIFFRSAPVQYWYSFLVSPSSCHALLPLVVRPKMTILELFLKIVIDFPKFNRSIIFSGCTPTMKNMNQFLPHFQIECSSGPTSAQVLSPIGIVLVESWQISFFFFGFAFINLLNHSHSFLTHILRTPFQKFPLIVVQIRDQFVETMRNSDPRERMVLVHTLNYDFHPFYHEGNKLWLLNRVQSYCFLGSQLLVRIIFHLLAMCTHDSLWIVRFMQCLSSWNTVRLQLSSGILHQYKICSLSLVQRTFSIRSLYCSNRRSVWAQRHVCLDHAWYKWRT